MMRDSLQIGLILCTNIWKFFINFNGRRKEVIEIIFSVNTEGV